MWQKLKTYWHPPFLADDDEIHSYHVLHTILWMACGILLVMGPLFYFSNSTQNQRLFSLSVNILLFLCVLGMLYALRRGHTRLISRALIGTLFFAMLPFYFFGDDLTLLAMEYAALIMTAGLLLSERDVTRLGAVSMIIFGLGLIMRAQGWFALVPLTNRAFWNGLVALTILGLSTLMLRVALSNLHQNLLRARHSEARNRALLEAVPDLLFRFNREGVFLDYQVNKDHVLFLSNESFLGKTIDESIPELSAQARSAIQQTLKTGKMQTFEYSLQMPDRLRNFEARFIKTGPEETMAIIRDITEKRQGEAERREQEARLQAYLNESPITIYILDLTTYRSIFFNRESFCGYTREELETTNSIQHAIHPEDQAQLKAHWEQILQGKAVKSAAIYRLKNKTGTWEWIEETKTIISHTPSKTPKEVLVMLSIITERKLAEEKIHQLNAQLEQRVAERTAELAVSNAALRQSEMRYETVTDLISEFAFSAYTLADGTPVIDWLTPSVERVTGYTPEEFLAQGSWTSILHPEDREAGQARYRVGISPRPINAEIRIVTKSGAQRWVWTRARPELDAAGNPIRLLGIVTDITERKLAETALRENEAKLRAIFELLPVGVSVLTPERQIVEINPALEKILGIRRAELFQGKYANRTYIRADGSPMRPEEFASIRAFTERRPIYDVETGVIKEDGSLIWTNVNAAPLPQDGVVVVTMDITERKQAERRQTILYETLHRIGVYMTPEEVLHAAVETISHLNHWMSVAISTLNPDGETWTTRAGAGPLVGKFGKARSKNYGVIGRAYTTGISQLVPDINLDPDYFRAEGQPSPTHCEIAVPIKHRDQILGVLNVESDLPDNFSIEDLNLAESLADAVALSLDNALLYSSLQNELAERKQAEARLQLANAELARSNADLERFAYAVSHDLQEPLRQVTQFAQLLDRLYHDQLGRDADEIIAFIVEGAGRMNVMVKGLLDYSRLGRENQAFVTTDCNQVLQKALTNLQLRLDESGGQVTSEPLPRVTGNEVLLTLLFQNLINNAIKFRSIQSPIIHVSAEQSISPVGRSEWVLRVQDNGIGISPEYFERIFGIFQRLHTREEFPGTGIGLALCKRIVELHEGRIWVISTPEEGSTFFFTLPFAA